MAISSFYGLQTSLRGLLAQQRAIDVTGHNIANASTAGYSRQEAVLSASPAMQLPPGAISGGGSAQLGSGVDVQSYRRVRDGFLDLQFRAQAMRLGEHSATAAGLDRAELAFAEPSDEGISSQLARFWNAWSDLSNAPEDPAARGALVQQSKSLADSFANVASQLGIVRSQAAGEYAAVTGPGGDVAAIAKELAQLNGEIQRHTVNGGTAPDLADRRDLLLDKLSSLGQVSTSDMGDGLIQVSFGDAVAPIVDGTTVTWPQAMTSPGGRLGALVKMSSPGGTLDGYQSALNAVARQLADGVNAVHSAPPFFSFTPGDEAATLTVAVTSANVRAGTGAAGSNDLALAIAAQRGGAADDGYRSLVASIGTDVREAKRQESNASALAGSVDDRRQSVSGVGLDEEMTNLIRFQRAYQASARAMSTMDEMLDVLVNRTGRVGL